MLVCVSIVCLLVANSLIESNLQTDSKRRVWSMEEVARKLRQVLGLLVVVVVVVVVVVSEKLFVG